MTESHVDGKKDLGLVGVDENLYVHTDCFGDSRCDYQIL